MGWAEVVVAVLLGVAAGELDDSGLPLPEKIAGVRLRVCTFRNVSSQPAALQPLPEKLTWFTYFLSFLLRPILPI